MEKMCDLNEMFCTFFLQWISKIKLYTVNCMKGQDLLFLCPHLTIYFKLCLTTGYQFIMCHMPTSPCTAFKLLTLCKLYFTRNINVSQYKLLMVIALLTQVRSFMLQTRSNDPIRTRQSKNY